MPPDRTRRRPSCGHVLVVGAALTALASGCSGSGSPDGAGCPSPTPAPAAELALMPTGLSFDGVGPVTRVSESAGHVNVKAVSTQPIEELTVAIQDAVTRAGYRPAGMDNEGFEAEVFFTAGTYAAGQALVRGGDCEGQWDIDLVLVDTSQLPSPSATPKATPNATPSATAG